MKKFLLNTFVLIFLILVMSPNKVFADIKVKRASIGFQQGNSVQGTAGDVTYIIDIACAGTGNAFSTININSSELPSGTTTLISSGTFNVLGNLVFIDNGSGTIILTVHSDGSVVEGTYTGFSITFSSSPDVTTNVFTYEVSGPVPVELTSFSGSVNNNVVLLKWATATEVNNYGFEIERSSSALGTSWEKNGFVNGNGNSNSPKEYSYTDNNLKSGCYSYRLKQIDNDGTYDYSNTIKLNVGIPVKLELKQNYPNPFNPSTTISFTIQKSGNISLKIYNSLGEEIATLLNGYTEAGVYYINYQEENLPSGFYVYQLKSGEASLTKKMLLLK